MLFLALVIQIPARLISAPAYAVTNINQQKPERSLCRLQDKEGVWGLPKKKESSGLFFRFLRPAPLFPKIRYFSRGGPLCAPPRLLLNVSVQKPILKTADYLALSKVPPSTALYLPFSPPDGIHGRIFKI